MDILVEFDAKCAKALWDAERRPWIEAAPDSVAVRERYPEFEDLGLSKKIELSGKARAVIDAACDQIGWPNIHAFQDELRKGQDVREDAGGFFIRAIKALFGRRSTDPVETYRMAARRMIEHARS